MSLTFGFYNSINHDRKYNAEQLSAIFDGVINDGVFMSIGSALMVTSVTGMYINVGDGRAWFNSTWTNNDASLPLTVEQSELILNRIDTVVLEVNSGDDVRANSIKILKGTPSSTPVAPTLTKTEYVNQYPLSDIYIGAAVTEITQANITNRVGTSDCPFVTGILETLDIDALLVQWNTQFQEVLNTRDDEYVGVINQRTADFDAWFANIQNQLSGDVAGNLQVQITNLKDDYDAHEADNKIHIHYGGMTTNSGNNYVLGIPVITSLTEGDIICFVANASSNGATTLNWSGMGAKALKNVDGSPVANLLQNGMYTFRYNGTDLIMQGGTGSGSGADLEAREQIEQLERKIAEQGLIDFVNQSGCGFYDDFATDEYIDKVNTSVVFSGDDKAVRFSDKDLPVVTSLGSYVNTNVIDVDQQIIVGDKINGVNVDSVTQGSVSAVKNLTSDLPIVDNSAFDTTMCAPPQYLSNGWIVLPELRSGVGIYFRVSKDFGSTWSELCFFTTTTITRFAVTSKGLNIYFVVEDGTEIWSHSFNASTITDSNIVGSTNPVRIDYSQTSFGDGISLIVTSDNRLMVAYSCTNSLSTALGIKMAYSTDLGATWSTPIHVVTSTTINYLYTWPCLVEKANGLISILCSYAQTTTYKRLMCYNMKSDLTAYDTSVIVHNNAGVSTNYDQLSPVCMRVKNGTHTGRLVLVWYGYISTTYYHIKLSYSDDNGATWSNGIDLTPTDTSLHNINPTLIHDNNGRVYIMWSGNYSTTTPYRIKYKYSDDCVSFSDIIAITTNTTGVYSLPIALPIVFTGTLPPYIYTDRVTNTLRMNGNLTFEANSSHLTLASNVTITPGETLTLTRIMKLAMKTQSFDDTFNNLNLAIYPKVVNKTTVKGAVNNSTSVVTNIPTRTLSVGDKLFMNNIMNEILNLTPNTINNNRSTEVNTTADVIFKSARPVRLGNGWIVTASYNSAYTDVIFNVSKDNGATWIPLTTWTVTRSTNGAIGITSRGNKVYAVSQVGGDIAFTRFDVTTVGSTVSTISTIAAISSHTAKYTIQILINDAGTINVIDKEYYASSPYYYNSNYKSLDDGMTWMSQAGVAGGESISSANGYYDVAACYNQLGNLVVMTVNAATMATTIWNGSSWVTNASVMSIAGQTNLSTDVTYNGLNMLLQKYGAHAGRIWAVWHGIDSTDATVTNIKVGYSDDNGTTWNYYKLTNGNIYAQMMPTLSEDQNGNVDVVWSGYTIAYPTTYNLRRVTYDGSNWSAITEMTAQNVDNFITPASCDNFHDYTIPLILYKNSYKLRFVGNFDVLGGYNLTMQNAVTLSDGDIAYIQDYTVKSNNVDLTIDSIDSEKHVFKGEYLVTKDVDLDIVSDQETLLDGISYAVA